MISFLPVEAGATKQRTQVFSETTSFEDMVRTGELAKERKPASLSLKFRVISVRRELALTEEEARKTPQDIVINGGLAEGVSKGMTLSVVRKVPVIDPFLNNKQKELEVEFARVKVIHSQENLSIARMEDMDSVHSGAGVGIRGVLIGDYIISP